MHIFTRMEMTYSIYKYIDIYHIIYYFAFKIYHTQVAKVKEKIFAALAGNIFKRSAIC